MHGERSNSNIQKISLTAIHLAALAIVFWILFGSGKEFIFGLFGQPAHTTELIPHIILFSCGAAYFLRLCITSFVLLKRKMAWNEVLEVGLFVAFIQIFFAILTIYYKADFYPIDVLLIALFVLGSYLNTGSEWQRMIWKRDSSNKGKLYTEGLFKYSMHINYFGDSVSFTGFALLTGSIWALTVPLAMTLGFIFMHIPKLDAYLRERYKEQFKSYSKKTKKFIPWIY